MGVVRVTVGFELKDGRLLECQYLLKVVCGNVCGLPEDCYPDEVEASEEEFFLDGERVEYSDLPRGLGTVANQMAQADSTTAKFTWTEEQEYDDGYYDYD